MIALLAQWAKADDRENRRTDRRKDTHGDEELDAYNNMLAGMAAQTARATRVPLVHNAPTIRRHHRADLRQP